jgi:hypothetical protein
VDTEPRFGPDLKASAARFLDSRAIRRGTGKPAEFRLNLG